MENWTINLNAGSSHRVLLLEALYKTSGKVVELGCGENSTPYLRDFCLKHDREFVSYENHKEWAEKWGAVFVSDWDHVNEKDISVLFIDHSPAERRGVDLDKFKDSANLIVIHDTEGSGYGYDQHLHLFDTLKTHVLFDTETKLLKRNGI